MIVKGWSATNVAGSFGNNVPLSIPRKRVVGIALSIAGTGGAAGGFAYILVSIGASTSGVGSADWEGILARCDIYCAINGTDSNTCFFPFAEAVPVEQYVYVQVASTGANLVTNYHALVYCV
jgi:hypothetical protein